MEKTLAHGYRTLQHWNQWLHKDFLGGELLSEEKAIIANLLDKHYGKHGLLVGVPNQFELLEAAKIPCHSLVSPFMSHERQPGFIEGDFHQLPILSGSVDLVVLPHTFEYVENPRGLIGEACRVVKPEGLILVIGFNPSSLWGLKKLLSKNDKIPFTSNFVRPGLIKNWLNLAEFQVEDEASTLVRPPTNSQGLYKALRFLEVFNYVLPSIGSLYFVVARAKIIPLTPIRMKWKQQLGKIRITTSIPGNIAG